MTWPEIALVLVAGTAAGMLAGAVLGLLLIRRGMRRYPAYPGTVPDPTQQPIGTLPASCPVCATPAARLRATIPSGWACPVCGTTSAAAGA